MKKQKISLVTYLLSLIVMALAAVAIILYINKKQSNNNLNIIELNTVVDNAIDDNKVIDVTNTVDINTEPKQNKIIDNLYSKIEISMPYESMEDMMLNTIKYVKIEDTQIINQLVQMINNSEEWTATITFYKDNKEDIQINVSDNVSNGVNLFEIYDYNNKSSKLYKTDSKIEELANNLYIQNKDKIEEKYIESEEYEELTEEKYKKTVNEKNVFQIQTVTKRNDGQYTFEGVIYERIENLPNLTKEKYQALENGENIDYLGYEYKKSSNRNELNGHSMIIEPTIAENAEKLYVDKKNDGTGKLVKSDKSIRLLYKETDKKYRFKMDGNSTYEWGSGSTTKVCQEFIKSYTEDEMQYKWIIPDGYELTFKDGKCVKLYYPGM